MSSSWVVKSKAFPTTFAWLSAIVLPGVGARSLIVGATRSIRMFRGTSTASDNGAMPGRTKNANGWMPSVVDEGRSHAILNVLYEFCPIQPGVCVVVTGAAHVARLVVVTV